MTTQTRCPEAILDAIPWYPVGLGESERGAVEAHVADCAACREEIGFVLGIEPPAERLPEAERIFGRVLARIASGEGEAPAVAPASPRSRRAAAAGLLAAMLAGALGGGLAAGFVADTPVYEVASAPLAPAAAGPVLDVVFRPEATAGEIREQLRTLGAQVVDGPSARGVYRVRLAAGADVGAALASLERAGGGIALFAQPGVD